MGVFRSDGGWAAQEGVLTRPFIVSMSPPGCPSAWLRPRSAALVSLGKIIVAPQRPAVFQHPVGLRFRQNPDLPGARIVSVMPDFGN